MFSVLPRTSKAEPAAKPAQRSAQSMQNERDRSARIQSAKSRTLRDISDGRPDCLNPDRRAAGLASLEFFCRTYFPATFYLPWSNDHRTAIAKLELAANDGGQFAYAMARGSGKTSLAEAATLRAVLYGLRRFPALIGSDQGSALGMLDSIKRELETNDLLDEDFHFTCGPIRALEGIAHRCNGQLYNGTRTHILWTKEMIVLPTVPGSLSSGTIVRVAGITGRIRGMKHKRTDGQTARPDIAIIDDPQTDESAHSPSQVQQRIRLIVGAVLGLAGPGKKIAAMMPCTVIAPGDVADQLLDKKKHPEWQGERAKLMYSPPSDTKLWDEYAQLRANSVRAGNKGAEATEFYQANREAMDAGANVAWAARKNADELSAVQHAMNLKLDLGEAAFAAEYQNDPLVASVGDEQLSVDEIAAKVNGTARGSVPVTCDYLTAFIDVQGKLLYWLVAGWSQGFGGAIIDYGSFPDQKRGYYTLADSRHTLARAFPKAGMEGQIFAGLEATTGLLLGKKWLREDGAELRISKLLIDANWGDSTDTVYGFCRQSPHGAIIMPSHGQYVGASSMPWEMHTKRDGEVLGNHWSMPPVKLKRVIRHVLIDTNFWKSFIHSRLAVARGDKGSLSLCGRSGMARTDHQMLAEHLTAEYGIKTQGRGRTVTEWKMRPGRADNHFFDGIVGAAVAASMLGIVLGTAPQSPRRKVAARRKFYPMKV